MSLVGISKGKRCIDVSVSLIGIVALSPLLLLLFVILRLDGGPTVFSHTRVGRNGAHFKCYKFRTMHKDAEQRLAELLSRSDAAALEWETHFKLKEDRSRR